MSYATVTAEFLKNVERQLAKALAAIEQVLDDKTAPAATRLRAAFGVIDLVVGRTRPSAKSGEPAWHIGPVEAPRSADPDRKETPKERYARQRREHALARRAAAGG